MHSAGMAGTAPIRLSDARAGFQVLLPNDNDLKVRAYKKRKLHSKTKSGCLTCKTKRVKCDETRPVCVRCQRNSRPCIYTSQSARQPQRTTLQPETSSDGPSPVSALSAVTIVPFPCPSARNGTSSFHLMQHFNAHWSDIILMPRGEELVSLFKTDPLVRNSLLAITACHLRHMSPPVVSHRIAEHFQQSVALQQYQRALETPPVELTQIAANSLILSSLLLNVLAFATPEFNVHVGFADPSTSWVFSQECDRLGWLVMQAGLRPLLISMTTYLDGTMSYLSSIILGDTKEAWNITRVHQNSNRIPQNWLKAFTYGRSDGDVFLPPLTVLACLRYVEPSPFNIYKSFQFLVKMGPAFRSLLYENDERALWVFGYWLGLTCRFESAWWCDQRVKRDYKAIRMWLDQLNLTKHGGEEGETWRQLMEEYEAAPTLICDKTLT